MVTLLTVVAYLLTKNYMEYRVKKMTKMISDPIFGEMMYRHGWTKKDHLMLWGQEYIVNTSAEAYTGDEILDSQRDAFKKNKDNIAQHSDKMILKTTEYFEFILGIVNINKEDVIAGLIPRTILFRSAGSWGILFDSKWEEEHGFAIFVIDDKIEVGDQDTFL